VTAAGVLAVLTGVLGIGGAVWVLLRAQHTADTVVAAHPDISRQLVVDVTYGVAAVSVAISVLYLIAARALLRGRRWAWTTLIVLTSIGLLKALGRPSLFGLLSLLPDVALLGCLLAPSTRSVFRRERSAQAQLPAANSPY
jgi:hypothetical protein